MKFHIPHFYENWRKNW